eukprot:4853681-Amphidinium_carterae.3
MVRLAKQGPGTRGVRKEQHFLAQSFNDMYAQQPHTVTSGDHHGAACKSIVHAEMLHETYDQMYQNQSSNDHKQHCQPPSNMQTCSLRCGKYKPTSQIRCAQNFLHLERAASSVNLEPSELLAC